MWEARTWKGAKRDGLLLQLVVAAVEVIAGHVSGRVDVADFAATLSPYLLACSFNSLCSCCFTASPTLNLYARQYL